MPTDLVSLDQIRCSIRQSTLPEEGAVLKGLIEASGITSSVRDRIVARATDLIREIRSGSDPSLMDEFLSQYGLSTDEGVALMCLAEALLRVPDDETIDALIEDKIVPSTWGKHLGKSSSSLVNASTWALMLTGKVLDDDEASGVVGALRSAIRRLGEPVIRTAVEHAMRELGSQFVLGRDIEEATVRAGGEEAKGYTYSYDMLGEAARTEADARRYHLAYADAISTLAKICKGRDGRTNPGISVKLSALHPRYEYAKRARVMAELVPRTRSLAQLAKSAGMGFNIDAEEADRLDLSLDVIEALLSDPSTRDWDGFGVVIQAYGPRASYVIDWLYGLAGKLDQRLMVRLVKGAYWDTEIKRAQTLGLAGFPVFTRKASTDVSYICCAKKLLGMTDRLYPQFATHNAHTVAAILELAEDPERFEFQRLHGMGEMLHDKVLQQEGTRCRIYAPVGAHRDLLAYLVRRLLENGANSSFVNQIVDESAPPEEVASDPFKSVLTFLSSAAHPAIVQPADLYLPDRENAKGWDLTDPNDMAAIEAGRSAFINVTWQASPIIAGSIEGGTRHDLCNPAKPRDVVGQITDASAVDIEMALSRAVPFSDASDVDISVVLNKAANLYEDHAFEFFALATREAGKTLLDCVGELREAVDFLRYYAAEARRLSDQPARGIFACISPWNFPLAIFTGQIAAALAAGNGVIAKPAEATPLIAARAVGLLHEAGVPIACLQLLPGPGPIVGAALASDPRIDGLCFTGSTTTAQHIHRSMAESLSPDAPLIAETGGLNAMIIDSTALPEQAVRDILASSFQSAGQRCSALRILYLQEEIKDSVLAMLFGAMDELTLGDPWNPSTDIGPIIDDAARARINQYIEMACADGCLLKQNDVPEIGTFVGPTVLEVSGIEDLTQEIFGPVLHVATFDAAKLNEVIGAINSKGYGLTFGLHTRIDDRVQAIVEALRIGNIYVNRNQIGAIVGSQPFGGEGLSGTGPKAGGPHYVQRFKRADGFDEMSINENVDWIPSIDLNELKAAIAKLPVIREDHLVEPVELPGPTGESNRFTLHPRGLILCLGPSKEAAAEQVHFAKKAGCSTLAIAPGSDDGLDGRINLEHLAELDSIAGVVLWDKTELASQAREALARKPGPIIPLITERDVAKHCMVERHLCIDTTAAGGNASLLSKVAD